MSLIQTFLPYEDFAESAKSLDDKRLGKQRAEAIQVCKSLTLPEYGWKQHPAVKMWRGYVPALAVYGMTIAHEWVRRGYQDTTSWFFADTLRELDSWGPDVQPVPAPPWLGDASFHASHRSNLVKKLPEYYAPQFGGMEFVPYLWPEVDPRDLSYSFRISAADAKRAAAGELTLPNLWEFDAKSRGVRVIVD